MNNVVVAQEIIYIMCNMKGKRGFMAVKIDLKKAYNRLNWDFVIDSLYLIGLDKI